jgi:hypothetical protein
MTRVIEKRDWLNVLAKCNTLQDELVSCVNNSSTFKEMPKDDKMMVRSFARSYIFNYISLYTTKNPIGAHSMNPMKVSGFDKVSQECSFEKLHECCKDNYNLQNLKGYYESTLVLLPKVLKINEKEQGPYRYKQ